MTKREMFELFKQGKTSDSVPQDSDMYFAMYAYEQYGDATRDNTFEDLVYLGKKLEEKGGAE